MDILIIIGKVMAVFYMGIGFLWFWSKIFKLLSKPFRRYVQYCRKIREEDEAFTDWVFNGDKDVDKKE